MPNDNPISPQEAEAMIKRLLAVAELLARARRKRRRSKKQSQNPPEKRKCEESLYRYDVKSGDTLRIKAHVKSQAKTYRTAARVFRTSRGYQ